MVVIVIAEILTLHSLFIESLGGGAFKFENGSIVAHYPPGSLPLSPR